MGRIGGVGGIGCRPVHAAYAASPLDLRPQRANIPVEYRTREKQ